MKILSIEFICNQKLCNILYYDPYVDMQVSMCLDGRDSSARVKNTVICLSQIIWKILIISLKILCFRALLCKMNSFQIKIRRAFSNLKVWLSGLLEAANGSPFNHTTTIRAAPHFPFWHKILVEDHFQNVEKLWLQCLSGQLYDFGFSFPLTYRCSLLQNKYNFPWCI